MIWEYNHPGDLLTAEAVASPRCIYCQAALLRLPAQAWELSEKRLFSQVSVCPQCGWWSVYRVHQGEHPRTAGLVEGYSGSVGCLKELDLADISVPLTEVRRYLLARRESIYDAHPCVFEEVVCSVFRDLGWEARVTAYSGDDGIDVVLDGPSGSTVGVQVKRYRKECRIEAEQIRSLAGALLLGGHTRGIFVTTSAFRRGAVTTAERFGAAPIGLPIELVDAGRFLAALGIAQRRTFDLDPETLASYILCKNVHLGSGTEAPFTRGENLLDRPVLARAFAFSELIDLRGT